jgi:hypothetical protein
MQREDRKIMSFRKEQRTSTIVIAIATLLIVMACTVSSSAQSVDASLPDAPALKLLASTTDQAQQNQAPPPATSANPPLPSSDSQTPLSLGDLGLTPDQIKGNAKAQALLDKRTRMLKDHQRLGLLTTIPLAATLFASAGAPCNHNCGPSTGADLHAALGSVTVGMYAATAYFAIAAPKIPGIEKKGAIRWHEALAFIHGPGMVLTPILGVMALKQQNAGEKVHGIAAAHSAVALTTATAYGVSIIAVSWPIKIKFWEH